MSAGDDYGHRQGRNGEFCVTVGPVTRTADILTQSVGLGLYASLIGFNPRRLSAEKGMSSHATDLAVYAKSSSSSSSVHASRSVHQIVSIAVCGCNAVVSGLVLVKDDLLQLWILTQVNQR